MTKNHDFLVYKDYYQNNLLNWDSKILQFGEELNFEGKLFIHPTKDIKEFTGKLFDVNEWRDFQKYALTNGYSQLLDKSTKIQISSPKNIQKEFRFFIVGGKISTGSLYKFGRTVCYSDIIDEGAIDFCKKMINIFQLASSFVMDVCLIGNQWKIIECGCINCAGFYKANINKLLNSIENEYN